MSGLYCIELPLLYSGKVTLSGILSNSWFACWGSAVLVHVAERRGGASRGACARVAVHVEKQLGCPTARSSRSFAADDRLVRSRGEVLRKTRTSHSRRSAATMGDLHVVGASSWVTGSAMDAQSWAERSSTAPCELDEGSSVVGANWELDRIAEAMWREHGN